MLCTSKTTTIYLAGAGIYYNNISAGRVSRRSRCLRLLYGLVFRHAKPIPIMRAKPGAGEGVSLESPCGDKKLLISTLLARRVRALLLCKNLK